MCFHLSIHSSPQKIEKQFGKQFINKKVKNNFNVQNYHFNGFDHPELPIITQELPNTLLPAVWGIVPPQYNKDYIAIYYKKANQFGAGLNARVEKIFTHFLYKQIYSTQRCIIVVDAFFEPHHYKNKIYPYLIKNEDEKMLALAGLYTRFLNGLITCTILTKPAAGLLEEIHNKKKRQPVLLNKKAEKQWLNNNTNQTIIHKITQSSYQNKLIAYPVNSTLFNTKYNSNVKNILSPYHYPELQILF